jgi:diguanylate cyclase (GGDEF)-like protein
LSIFGRRVSEKRRPVTLVPSARPDEGAPERGAIDTLGAVLLTMGRVSFEVDDEPSESFRQTFERWAQHVLVAAPIDAEDGKSDRAGARDWAAIRQSVLAHRRREVGYVVKAIDDLRRALCLFTTAFSRVVGEDGKADSLVKEQLARLEGAAKDHDTDAITREALATVQVVGESIDRRAARHRAQLGELGASVRHLTDQLQQAKQAGETDGLTRVPNRRSFDDFLVRAAELAPFASGELYLMMVDVDRFKPINDAYGHGAGDTVLKAVADCLARTFPRRGDLVARYGGDEFAVVLRDVRAEEARMLADRLVTAIRGTKVEHQGQTIRLSVSVGIAPRLAGDSSETWLARADAALYQAKKDGRDRWAETAT